MKKSIFASILMAAACTVCFAGPYQDAVKAGNAARKAKNFEEAVKCFDDAFSKAGDVKQKNAALASCAEALVQQKKYDEAVAKLKEANALEGLPAELKTANLSRIAGLFGTQKKNDEMNAALQEAVNAAGDSTAAIDPLLRLAKNAANAKKYDEAEKQAKKALELAKGKNARPAQIVGAETLLAQLASAQGKTDDALKILDEAEKLDKLSDAQKKSLLNERINLLCKGKKYAEANALLEESLKNINDPDQRVNTYNRIARNWQDAGEYDKAVAAVDQASAVVGMKKAQPNVRIKTAIENLKKKQAQQVERARKAAEKAAAKAAKNVKSDEAAAPAPVPAVK